LLLNTLSKISKAAPSGAAFSLAFAGAFQFGTIVAAQESSIAKLIGPAVAAAGFELVRVRITGRDVKTLQVMAERPDKTMSADDCALLSHALSPLLDEKDPIAGSYRLEVSSPGIDRPLTRLKDYEDWQGYEAKMELNRMVEGRKRLKGVVAGTEGAAVLFDIEGESETAVIPFEWIADAKLILTDNLIRESLKAAKTAAKEQKTETPHERD
jgi:ribosome maturation factor RimP